MTPDHTMFLARQDDLVLEPVAVGEFAEFTSEGARKAWLTRKRASKPAAAPEPGSIGTVHADGISTGVLADAVGTTMHRRAATDLANHTGTPWAIAQKQASGKKLDAYEQTLLGVAEGDPVAIAKMVKRVDGNLDAGDRREPSTKPEFIAKVSDAAEALKDNAVMRSAVARYGQVPIAVVARGSHGEAGRYDGVGYIVVNEWANLTPVQAPLHDNRGQVDATMTGLLRHEYGHHVKSLTTEAQRASFAAAHDAWGGGLDPARVQQLAKDAAASGTYDDHGLSVYARTNSEEAFAETFALVSHPDFDRATVDARVAPMVDSMLEILK